jgi:hypothetical protein
VELSQWSECAKRAAWAGQTYSARGWALQLKRWEDKYPVIRKVYYTGGDQKQTKKYFTLHEKQSKRAKVTSK